MIDDVDLVMIHAVRCPQVTSQLIRAGLRPEHFELHTHKHLQLVWAAISSHYTEFSEPMNKLYLENAVMKSLEQYTGMLDVLKQNINGFIAQAYSVPEGDLLPDKLMSLGIMQNLINMLVVNPALREMASAADAASTFTSAVELYDQSRVVTNTRTDIFNPANRDKYAHQGPPDKSGVDWIDHIAGGIYRGSLCGLLAESAGGKTMAGVQIACAQTENNRCTLLFYYEQSIGGDIATRIYSYAAGIPRSRLNRRYEDYELEDRAALDKVQPHMDKYFHPYDMSGSVKGQGQGCVQEIDTIITAMKNDGHDPEFILIDWLGPMITAAFNMPELLNTKETRQKIEVTLSNLNRLTEKHNVTILVLHQIAPNIIEGKTPLYKPDWTVAQECKSFGLLMSYVFCFGRKDENKCMWLNAPKVRSGEPTARIVKMDPEANIIKDVHELYAVNPTPTKFSPTFMERSKFGTRTYDDSEGINAI